MTAEAYNLGRKAFQAGKVATPCLDKDLMRHLRECEDISEALMAWTRGWHQANANSGAVRKK